MLICLLLHALQRRRGRRAERKTVSGRLVDVPVVATLALSGDAADAVRAHVGAATLAGQEERLMRDGSFPWRLQSIAPKGVVQFRLDSRQGRREIVNLRL